MTGVDSRPAMIPFWKPPCLRRLVIINLRKGGDLDAIRGILWKQHGRWLIVKNGEALIEGQAPKPLDGETILDRDRVDFIQVLP